MSKINILDSTIYNRIAAGEVVERPFSVVKELVENSIDAGAGQIIIETEAGGTKSIKITDNGSGILFEDLNKAFLPHATSKINSVDDLEGIATLGFRGEALASIGSVSNITLCSKVKAEETGGEITVNGGKIEKAILKGTPDGTYISVNNLFFNTPARAKFLKTPKTEEGYITDFIARTILANPNISFKYICDGKIVYQTSGGGLEEAIYVVYGKSTVSSLLPVNYKNENISISGFIGKPTLTKPNRTYQTLIVNGRYVVNALVSTAVYNAYANYMMKGRFPFYVLNIKMPFEDVDVNVHPNKMEVKFVNTNAVYGAVTNAVSEVLLQESNILDAVPAGEQESFTTESLPKTSGYSFNMNSTMQSSHNTMQTEGETDGKIEELRNIKIEKPLKSKDINIIKLRSDEGVFLETQQRFEQNEQADKVKAGIMNTEANTSVFDEGFLNVNNFKIIGTIFNTYIIIEKQDEMFLIDQHAAHERLLYDKFKTEFENKKINIQELLMPYVLKVNSLENIFIKENWEIFSELGFNIEEFGNLSFKVSSVPLVLSNIELKAYFEDCLKNLNKLDKNNGEVKHFLATKACKAAVKAGRTLNENEISVLLAEIDKNKTTLLCPHGRPVFVRLKKTDIDKWFKRIV